MGRILVVLVVLLALVERKTAVLVVLVARGQAALALVESNRLALVWLVLRSARKGKQVGRLRLALLLPACRVPPLFRAGGLLRRVRPGRGNGKKRLLLRGNGGV
jgi:hypothetical protein